MSIDNTVSDKTNMVRGAWLVVALLVVVACLNYLDRIMITTMRESIVHAIPMTDAQFGLLTSVFLWTYGLLSPVAGFLADKFPRHKVIIGSLFLWSLFTYLTAHATTFNQLLATRALMGLSEACFLPAAMAMIADYHGSRTRSLATGILIGGVMVGQSLGFLGGWIAEEYHWSHAFSIFGWIGIGYAVVLGLWLRDAPERSKVAPAGQQPEKINFFSGIKNLFKTRSFVLLFIFWGLLGLVGWMILGWLPTYYKEHFKLSQSLAGLYATGYLYPISLLGSLVGGFLTDRWSKNNPAGRVLVPAVALLIAAPAVFVASSTSVVWIAIIGFMFYAFTRLFSDVNIMPILCLIIDNRFRATGYGVLNLFATTIGGLGIYASGVLRDAHFQMDIIFKIAAGVLLVCSLLLWMIKSNLKVNQP